MRALLAVALVACSTPRPVPTEDAFAQVADPFYDASLASPPTPAVRLGPHDRDGQLGDRSPAALTAEIARAHAALDALGRLSHAPVERDVLVNVARRELF